MDMSFVNTIKRFISSNHLDSSQSHSRILTMKTFFLSGIGGTGMSSLAFFLKAQGYDVRGSDRSFDQNGLNTIYKELNSYEIKIFPQDGSGLNSSIESFVYSSAIEKDNPDLIAAQKLHIPPFSRAQILGSLFNEKEGIAVCGTSGKSTVVGMISHILKQSEKDFSMLCGAKIKDFPRRDISSNFQASKTPLMLIEADESDGSLVLYKPKYSIITNISKDHKTLDELHQIFQHLINSTQITLILNKTCPELSKLQIHTKNVLYFDPSEAKGIHHHSNGSSFKFQDLSFKLNVPGKHNIENALAAITLCKHLEIKKEDIQKGLEEFVGVVRRLDLIGKTSKINVYDDYSHNPAKIEAAILSLKPFCKRLITIYQPHGFGPLKQQWDELIKVLSEVLDSNDLFYLLPIYDAGGTTDRNISSNDFANALIKKDVQAKTFDMREELVGKLKKEAQSGDSILVMGARDYTLTDLAKEIFKSIS